MTIREAARQLGLPERTARRWLEEARRAGLPHPRPTGFASRTTWTGRRPASYDARELVAFLADRKTRHRPARSLAGPATPESLARLDLVLQEIALGAPGPAHRPATVLSRPGRRVPPLTTLRSA
jgi:hypothetical protein